MKSYHLNKKKEERMKKIKTIEELTEKYPGLISEIKKYALEKLRSKKHRAKSMPSESQRIRREAKKVAGIS